MNNSKLKIESIVFIFVMFLAYFFGVVIGKLDTEISQNDKLQNLETKVNQLTVSYEEFSVKDSQNQ